MAVLIFSLLGEASYAAEVTIADNSIIDRLVREGFIEKLYKKR